MIQEDTHIFNVTESQTVYYRINNKFCKGSEDKYIDSCLSITSKLKEDEFDTLTQKEPEDGDIVKYIIVVTTETEQANDNPKYRASVLSNDNRETLVENNPEKDFTEAFGESELSAIENLFVKIQSLRNSE